jgi:hypothetical protein
MKKIFLLIVCSVGLLSTTFAQDEKEVMLFSEYNNVSTARSLGIGGAVGSLGADYAGISINPATLGKYSKGEFMYTPSLKLNRTSSNYLSKTSIENKSRLTFDNIGMVLANRKNQKRNTARRPRAGGRDHHDDSDDADRGHHSVSHSVIHLLQLILNKTCVQTRDHRLQAAASMSLCSLHLIHR